MAKRKAKPKSKARESAAAVVVDTPPPPEPVVEVTKRPGVYIWPTWLCGFLAADDNCLWSLWYRARWKWKRDDTISDDWKTKHKGMVEDRAAELRAQGYAVRIEDQNAITIRGDTATVGGKPDIIATKGRETLISDEKGGKKKSKDRWQVRIYMALYPFSDRVQLGPNDVIYGEIVYDDDEKVVDLRTDAKQQIFRLIQQVGSDVEPERVPSKRECGWCDVPNCPDRKLAEDHQGSAQGVF